MEHVVLSHFQVADILQARRVGRASAVVSLDLGLTTAEVEIGAEMIRLPDGQRLTWEQLGKIRSSERGCFVIEDDAPRKIQFFSQATNRLYSLMPTEGAPTMLVSGIPMHRFKDVDPRQDARQKIEAIAPVVGCILDTATGLGYTAIEAARTADRVVTVEIEPLVLEVARLNPWSQALFENPKITQVVGDVYDEIQAFEDHSFTRVIHDPPTFSLAGELYSGAFYRQLFRVLRRGGRLFHYVGDLESRTGYTIARGVGRRLREAGFRRVVCHPRVFGLVAYK